MANSGKNKRADAGVEDWKKYQDAWAEMMVTIWRDKIDKLKVVDTFSLRQTVEHRVINAEDAISTIRHKFLMYGIYQDCGVGRGFAHGNTGDLDFMDPQYRIEHGLDKPRKRGPAWGGGYTSGKPRKPREWYSRAYFASIKVLRDEMAYIFAENFTGLLVNAIAYADTHKSTSLRSHLWGHHAKTRGAR